jgi:hypothetical protein
MKMMDSKISMRANTFSFIFHCPEREDKNVNLFYSKGV